MIMTGGLALCVSGFKRGAPGVTRGQSGQCNVLRPSAHEYKNVLQITRWVENGGKTIMTRECEGGNRRDRKEPPPSEA
jgi:hypothetical protein